MERASLNVLNQCLPSFAKGLCICVCKGLCMCVCMGAHVCLPSTLWVVYNSALSFTSCPCRASMSTRSTRFEPTPFLLCIPLEMCVASLFPRNISELFKAFCEHIISQIFLLNFLANLLFVTTGNAASVAAVLNNFCSLFLTNTPEIGLFLLSYFWIRSNECVFSKDQPDRLN